MNQFYTRISLPSVLLDDSVLYSSPDVYRTIQQSDINQEVVRILNQRGLSIYSVEIFKTGYTNKRWPIHVDGPREGDMAKINWVYGNTRCDMKWFKRKSGSLPKAKESAAGPYIEYDEHDVEEIASFNIGTTSIVQTAIPHTVVNNSEQHRYCVSLNLIHNYSTCVPYNVVVNLLSGISLQTSGET